MPGWDGGNFPTVVKEFQQFGTNVKNLHVPSNSC